MTTLLLAGFAVRLACGLSAMLLLTSWRQVPLAFFRTQCQVVLGLLVLAALATGGAGGRVALGVIVAAAVLAYLGSISWGLGLPRVGVPIVAAVALATAGLLVFEASKTQAQYWPLWALGSLASAALLGSTTTAMLLGHHYLTAPAMTIEPLRRDVFVMAVALAVRAAISAAGLCLALSTPSAATAGSVHELPMLFLAMRWVVGVVGPAVATVLAWKTAAIRSTQSATGILYIALALVLVGELTALALGPVSGLGY